MALTVVYDANILHPASLRDLLIRLACTDLYRARWTDAILDEMVTSVIRANPELDPARLARTRHLMVKAVPDCLVTGYEPLIQAIELPDANDRHVVAAAIRCHAQIIVTNNLRDFPNSALSQFGIDAQSPDRFVHHLLGTAFDEVTTTIARQAEALSQPPRSYNQLLKRVYSHEELETNPERSYGLDE